MQKVKLAMKAIALVGLFAAASASATVYTYNGGGGNGPTGAANLISQQYWYDDITNNLGFTGKWSTTGANGAPEGAWLVLSDGPMPRTSPLESPIYYLDWKTGTNRITTYAYDGTVADGGANYFGSKDNALNVTNAAGTQTVSFVMNLATINAYNGTGWKGGDFGSTIGVWFHWFDQNSTNQITYTSAGANQYKVANVGNFNQGWYDSPAGLHTTSCSTTPGTPGYSPGCRPAGDNPSVPVPAVPLLVAVGLIGLGLKKRQLRVAK
jgi:hypothetical protein